MKKSALIISVFMVFLVSFCLEAKASEQIIISEDTVWEGEFVVPCKVIVLQGATLKIMPGSKVKFAGSHGIWINGSIEAVGEPGRRILFTVLNKTPDAYWHQIMVEKGRGNFVNCDFEYANIALHSHESQVKVQGCTFRHNKKGSMFRGGQVTIRQSEFVNNDFAVIPNLAVGFVAGNVIKENKVGILVRDVKDGKVLFRDNQIYNNSRYDLQMGEFNSGDIDVSGNWWGDGDPKANIFDELNEPGIGKAIYEPYAKEQFNVKSENF